MKAFVRPCEEGMAGPSVVSMGGGGGLSLLRTEARLPDPGSKLGNICPLLDVKSNAQ